MELLKQNSKIKVMAKFYELKQTGIGNGRIVVLNKLNHCVCCGAKDVAFIKIKNCSHIEFLKCYFEKRINLTLTHVCHYCHGMLKKIDDFKKQVERCLTTAEALLYPKPNLTMLEKPMTVSFKPKRRIMIEEFMFEDKLLPELRKKETASKTIEKGVIPQVKKEVEHDTNVYEMETDMAYTPSPTVVVKTEEESDLDFCGPDGTTEWSGPKLISTVSLHDSENTAQPVKKQPKTEEHSGTQKKAEDSDIDEKLYGKVQLVILSREELERERETEKKMEKYLALPIKCEDCIIGFGHQYNLTTHMRKHDTTKGDFICDICKCVYSGEDRLLLHQKNHQIRYQCVPCGIMFKNCTTCISHYNNTHGADCQPIDVVYECQKDYCDFKCSTSKEYRRHLRGHRTKPACSECGKIYASKTSLNLHIKNVHCKDHLIYKCDYCGKEYKAHNGLSQHIRNTHVPPKEQPLYFCQICGRQYKNKVTLALHLKIHRNHTSEESKKFICDICGKRFIIKEQLRDHMHIVHLKSEFKCKLCSTVCRLEKSLKRHIKTVHSTNAVPKPKILCDLCGKEFTSGQTLKSHMRTHTGERPFKCDTCGATFGFTAALYTHRRLVHKHLRLKDRVNNDSQNK